MVKLYRQDLSFRNTWKVEPRNTSYCKRRLRMMEPLDLAVLQKDAVSSHLQSSMNFKIYVYSEISKTIMNSKTADTLLPVVRYCGLGRECDSLWGENFYKAI